MRQRTQKLAAQISLGFMACLIWLVPFDAYRNIELQGLILVLAGGFAWLAIGLDWRNYFERFSKSQLLLGTTYIVSCLLSLAFNPNLSANLLGEHYIRLGAAGLIACVGCGLVAARLPLGRLMAFIYGAICLSSLLALPYSFWQLHSLSRPGGIFAQPDIAACFLGCGLIIGLYLWQQFRRWRWQLLTSQLFLLVILMLSQTRAAIVLTALLIIVWLVLKRRFTAGLLAILALGLVVASSHFLPNRLNDASYARQSVSYRLELQKAGLRTAADKPLVGYGMGNLDDALNCRKLTALQLQTTCRQGYYFNSSHNIYLDRVLGLGWIGGLSFLSLVVLAIYKSFRGVELQKAIGLAALLIASYYLTNVTSVTLELLLWVLLLAGSRSVNSFK